MKTHLLFAVVAVSAAALAQSGLPLPAAGGVTLSLEEYNKLVERAARPPRPADAPPFPFVIQSAQMNLQVRGDAISGTVLLEGEVFIAGERKVPLVAGMTVLDAQQKGRPLPIEQDAGVHTALIPGPGAFAVTLETGMPLTIETGRASFNLPAPAAGAVRLTLSVPGEQTQVSLSPGLITSRASAKGRTTIEATLVPGQTSNVWWASRLSAPPPAAPKEARFLSDVKTLLSVSEAELTMAALAEITVVQGEPAQFELLAPEGYELTGATGATLASSDVQPKSIILHVTTPAARKHQFLISMVRPVTGAKAEVPLLNFTGAQRETGEALVEGEGAVELVAKEQGGLRRMDIKETSPYLRSLARAPLDAAFRYQKRPAETPAVALEWVRFPDSAVLSAVAQHAAVTSLITSEGRSLTEVKLTVKNQAQPFLKVALPAGASILSAEVAGEKVKPVQGADGNRVPLLRAGFRPTDAYTVSYVFLHAGTPFGKKGGGELSLPRMDVPIGLVEWDVFLPSQYKVTGFGGQAVSARLLPPAGEESTDAEVLIASDVNLDLLGTGQAGGVITDMSGAVVPHATVSVVQLATGATVTANTDREGRWIAANVPAGRLRVRAVAPGFRTAERVLDYDGGRGVRLNLVLEVGSTAQAVTVTAESLPLNTSNAQVSRNVRQKDTRADQGASANVMELQRRVSGVLPIAVNVPRDGSSYRFVRPLVVDEETRLTFSYRSR